ncbi:hypothetical protein [Pararhizobium sp.]|uniref:hypothetical protein n=1 Tax=Pararhizobium sp. TaxID=1977563 RepID=UPI003D0CDB94
MKKADAERAIRSLSKKWFQTLPESEREHPSFGSFTTWLRTNNYGHFLDFRSTKVQIMQLSGGSIKN